MSTEKSPVEEQIASFLREKRTERKRELIKKHLEGWHGLRLASIQYFAESGKASGSFLVALEAMMDEYQSNYPR